MTCVPGTHLATTSVLYGAHSCTCQGVGDSRGDRRHNYQTSSWIQCLLTVRVWTEPGPADTSAARAQGCSASHAPLVLGLLTALERSDGENAASQSKTRWAFRLGGFVVSPGSCREVWEPLLPSLNLAASLHGTIRASPWIFILVPDTPGWSRAWKMDNLRDLGLNL